MTAKFDYKKEYKDLYMPKTKPMLINVPEMQFIMVNGKGDPNTSQEYKNAMEILYGLSWSIKMSKMSGNQPDGYFEYVMPPLEGLWWFEDMEGFDGKNITDKNKFLWTSMLRQPPFVTQEVFERAKESLYKKSPHLDLSLARLETFEEGQCAQIMHIGSYDEEAVTIEKLVAYIQDMGYRNDISDVRHHHEIYLGDPRKTAPEKRKTVIRYPISNA